MRWIAVVSERTEARDGSQQVVRLDTGAHLARCGRGFEQGPVDKRNRVPYKVEGCSACTFNPERRNWPHFDPKKEITVQDKPVALVTGANKGIGLQIAKDLAANGFTVLVGSRNLEYGRMAAKSVGADARALQLDVTNQASIAAAAERIRNELGRLDVCSST